MGDVLAFPLTPPTTHDTAEMDGELFTLCDRCEELRLDFPPVVTVTRRVIDGVAFDEFRCKPCRKMVERRRTPSQL
ncbi:hypothetical protein ACJ4V0_15655 [Phreatobacter sp. HK31-P]